MSAPDLGSVESWHLTWGRRDWQARSWLILVIVLALSAVYCVAWWSYVNYRKDYAYEQSAPGASAVMEDQNTAQVTRVEIVDRVSLDGDEPVPPTQGAVWVQFHLDVSGPTLSEVGNRCQFGLLGPDRRIWQPTTRYADRDSTELYACDEDITGDSAVIILTYEVPEPYVASLFGLIMPTPDRVRQVIRP